MSPQRKNPPKARITTPKIEVTDFNDKIASFIKNMKIPSATEYFEKPKIGVTDFNDKIQTFLDTLETPNSRDYLENSIVEIDSAIEDKKIEQSVNEKIKILQDDLDRWIRESKEQIWQINTYVIWIAIVAWLAAIWWISDSIWFHINTTREIQNLKIENQQLKNDIKNIHDDMELLVEKKYSEILKTQITNPKTWSSQ